MGAVPCGMRRACTTGPCPLIVSPCPHPALPSLPSPTLTTQPQRLEDAPRDGVPAEELEARDEARGQLRVLRAVLEQGGHFSGINRKAQLKPLRWSDTGGNGGNGGGGSGGNGGAGSGERPATAASGGARPLSARSSASGASALAGGDGDEQQQQAANGGGASGGASGEGGRQQGGAKGGAGQGGGGEVQELLLILKWGGVLTHAGRRQAEDLGRAFRLVMYPR